MIHEEPIIWDLPKENLTGFEQLRRKHRCNGTFSIKNDIPIMVSQQGELVCIEKTKDIPNIGVVGMKRTAKTLTSFGILDRIYHSEPNPRMAILNDAQFESPQHTFKNNVPFMKRKLGILNETPRPLPLVFLFPSLKDSPLTAEYKPCHRISIPFSDFLDEIHLFPHLGTLGETKKYFMEVVQKLKQCNNSAECFNVIDDLRAQQSKNKVYALLNYIFEEKIFDISADELPLLSKKPSISKLSVKNTLTKEEKLIDPLLGLMYAGLIPALMTGDLLGKEYGPDIFTYYLRKIMKNQEPDGLFGANNDIVTLFVDELETIQTQENAPMLAQCVTLGAHKRIMLNWSTQCYSKADYRLRTNTKFLISLRQTDPEADVIAKDFELDSESRRNLQNLKKEYFEAMVMSKGEKIKLYNPKTGKITYSNEGAIRGTILFPLSQPKLPTEAPTARSNCAKRTLVKNKFNVYTYPDKTRIIYLNKRDPLSYFNRRLHYAELREGMNLQKEFFGEGLEKTQHLSFSELERKGFCIVSVPATGLWFAGQSVAYFLWRRGQPIPAQGAIPLDFLPKDAIIIHDTVKKRIRLWGKNTGPGSHGEWIPAE